MGGMSPIHWLILLIMFLVPLPAIIRILHRSGHSGWWSILYYLPVVSWVGLYLFAYARWPRVEAEKQAAAF
jgi:hypothetical protein